MLEMAGEPRILYTLNSYHQRTGSRGSSFCSRKKPWARHRASKRRDDKNQSPKTIICVSVPSLISGSWIVMCIPPWTSKDTFMSRSPRFFGGCTCARCSTAQQVVYDHGFYYLLNDLVIKTFDRYLLKHFLDDRHLSQQCFKP